MGTKVEGRKKCREVLAVVARTPGWRAARWATRVRVEVGIVVVFSVVLSYMLVFKFGFTMVRICKASDS